LEAAALPQAGEAAQFPGIGKGKDTLGADEIGPADGLLLAADLADDVEPPGLVGGIKGDCLQRDGKLRAPAPGVAADLAKPKRIPLVVALVLVLHEPVVFAAGRGQPE